MRICAYSYFGEQEAANTKLITPEAIKNFRIQHSSIRRSDRYTALFAMAALDALEQAGVNFPLGADTGLIGVTAFGPHLTTFAMINEIIEFAEDEILPTKFSHSVLNAAPSYVNAIAGINGPTFALCGFDDVWFDAVLLAQSMLATGECRQILVVGCDEKTILTAKLAEFLPGSFNIVAQDAALAILLDNANGGRRLSLNQQPSTEEAEFFFGAAKSFRRMLDSDNDVVLRKSQR